MRLPFTRGSVRPAWVTAPTGDRVLAAASTADGSWLIGTRSVLAVVSESADPVVWPWEQIQAADWDAADSRLRVSLIGSFGERRDQLTHKLADADLLLQLVRERITASVVYQTHVAVAGKRGFKVIARRNPAGGEHIWMCDFDAGLDPTTPGVEEQVEAALARARDEIWDPI